MDVDLYPATELPPELTDLWVAWQADASLNSPFLRPEFTMAVAAEREDIFVAVISDGGDVGGVMPFQRCPDGIGRPVGLAMSNFQGVITAPGFEWEAVDLVTGCGIEALVLTHVSPAQEGLAPHHTAIDDSFAIDTSEGWASYVEDREAHGSKAIRKTKAKERRLERDLGPLEFVPYVDNEAMMDQLVEWKRERYPGTGSLIHDWPVRVCRRLMNERSADFAGMLTAVRAGDRVVALHMGIRGRNRWHHWYPAFDPELGRYSPGNILLLRMVQWAAESGIAILDLGKGSGHYKNRFSNRVVGLAQATVHRPYLLSPARRALGAQARRAVRILRRAAGRVRKDRS